MNDKDTILQRLSHVASDTVGAEGATLFFYNTATDSLTLAASSGIDPSWSREDSILRTASALARRAITSHTAIDVPDTSTLPADEFPVSSTGWHPGSLCLVPLENQEEIVGLLLLSTPHPRGETYPHTTLRALATLGGLTVSSMQDHEHERTLRTRLEVLHEASQTLAAELSLDRVLQHIVETAATTAHARYGALGVLGPDGYLADFITTGISPEERARVGSLPRGHGLLGTLIRLGRPLRVPDMSRDPRRVGFPPNHPVMTSLLGVPIRVHNEVVGDLYLTDKLDAPEFSDDDQHLIEILAAHAGVAIENARLYTQVRDFSILHERERIGRDLHDGIIQDIYGATLHLEDIAEDITDDAVRTHLERVTDSLSNVITDVRTYIQGLRARLLAERALSEGMAALVGNVMDQRGPVAAYTVAGEPYRLPDEMANALLQIAREALTNVVKHANATHVDVSLAFGRTEVVLTVADDGRGFDPQAPRGAAHHGLPNLHVRAEQVGGTCVIQSIPGSGTTVVVRVPTSILP